MVERRSQSLYPQLHDRDSVRLLELTRVHEGATPFSGRLITTRLDESPDYVALSYVWGKQSSNDPMLRLNAQSLQIRASLWQALHEMTTCVNTIVLWADQICID
jgi:hypothetical protein